MPDFTPLDSLMINFEMTFLDRSEKIARLKSYLAPLEAILIANKSEKKFQALQNQYDELITQFTNFNVSKGVVDLIRTNNPDLSFKDLDEAGQKSVKQYYQDAEKVKNALYQLEILAEPMGAKVLRIVGGVIGFILGAVIGGLIFHIAFGGPLTVTGLAGGAIGLTGGSHFGMGIGVTIARDAFQIFSGISNIFGGRNSMNMLQKHYYETKDQGGLFFKRPAIEDMDHYALIRNAANEALELIRDDAKTQPQLPPWESLKFHLGL